MNRVTVASILLGGVAGGAAWFGSMLALFGPSQSLLADPSRQSAKMLAAFAMGDSAPRMVEAPWIVPVGFVAISLLWSAAYAALDAGWRVSWRTTWPRRGLALGALAWTFMVPWFEFYLPWNVLLEPAPLVFLELACWAGVLLCVGLAIAGTHALVSSLMTREKRPPLR